MPNKMIIRLVKFNFIKVVNICGSILRIFICIRQTFYGWEVKVMKWKVPSFPTVD